MGWVVVLALAGCEGGLGGGDGGISPAPGVEYAPLD
jgi:hypothetical protein